jgi:hypothetical protein
MADTLENTIEKVSDAAEQASEATEQVVRAAIQNPWVERVTRLGFAVSGLIYAATGALAIEVALGLRRTPEDPPGLIALIAAQPYGPLLLVVMAVGLAGLSLWGLGRFIYDPHDESSPSLWGAREFDKERIAMRLGYLISGAAYGGLSVGALRALAGARAAVAEGAEQAASGLMATPWGPWLVGAVGLLLAVFGALDAYQATRANFTRQFQLYELDERRRRLAEALGRFGTVMRGAVIGLLGVMLLRAALIADPDEVLGLDDLLLKLAREAFGPWLLAVVALGLLAYGVYAFLGALWFRLRREEQAAAPEGEAAARPGQ